MSYIESSKIEVFPSALRSFDQQTGKYTSENNLTGILRAATKDSFVISPYEIVIHGYYFKLTDPDFDLSDLLDNTGNLYAKIRLDGSGRLVNTNTGGSDLDTVLDADNTFQGLYLDTTEIEPETNEYVLQIFSNGNLINTDRLDSSMILVGSGSNTSLLSDVLESKQDELTAGNGINISDDTVSVDMGYVSSSIFTNKVGSENQPVYIDPESSGSPIKEVNFRIFYGTSEAVDTDPKNGDIVIIYEA